jgi:hypothetical protein
MLPHAPISNCTHVNVISQQLESSKMNVIVMDNSFNLLHVNSMVTWHALMFSLWTEISLNDCRMQCVKVQPEEAVYY